MTIVETIVKAARTKTLIIGISSVLGGSAAAACHGNFELIPATLCLLFVIFAQISGNLYQKYYETRYNIASVHAMEVNDRRIFARVALHEAARGTLVIALTIGLAIASMVGWWSFIVGIVILVLFYFYNMSMKPLYRSPYAIIVTFIVFGPIATIATSLVQSQHSASGSPINWFDIQPAAIMSIITGLMAMNYHVISSLSTHRENLDSGKMTLAIKKGKDFVINLYLIDSIIVLVVGIFSAIYDGVHLWWVYAITPIICTIFNLYIYHIAKKDDCTKETYVRMLRYSGYNMFIMCLMSLILLYFIGVPQATIFEYF